MSMISRTATSGQPVFSQIDMLRRWYEPSAGFYPSEIWWASLFDPRSRQRRHFRSAAALTAYLAAFAPSWFRDDGELEAQA